MHFLFPAGVTVLAAGSAGQILALEAAQTWCWDG
jgi:hypothetical protein